MAHTKEYMHAYYEAHRERIRAQHRAYYYADHARSRKMYLGYARTARLKQYGLTLAEYDAMVEAQHGLCAICGRPERVHHKGTRVRLAVDHDAKTGKVRGLLCSPCNRGIGMMQHNPEILKAAIRYLGGG